MSNCALCEIMSFAKVDQNSKRQVPGIKVVDEGLHPSQIPNPVALPVCLPYESDSCGRGVSPQVLKDLIGSRDRLLTLFCLQILDQNFLRHLRPCVPGVGIVGKV